MQCVTQTLRENMRSDRGTRNGSGEKNRGLNLAGKPQFSTNFSHKSIKHSSTIVLPWKHWVSHETQYVLKTKAYKFILKVRKFQLPTVYSFSRAERETWIREGETWLR